MTKKLPAGSVCGIAAVISYIILTLAAYLRYPEHINPQIRALSDLGSPLQNPSGYMLYNIGGIIMGLLLIPFYISLNHWKTENRTASFLVTAAQITGIISSTGLILSCIFSVDTNNLLHGISASTAFISSTFFWIFSSFAQLKIPGAIKWMGYFGLLPLVINISLYFIPESGFISEWFSVGIFLVYIEMLVYETRVIISKRIQASY
jgi:hypothetical protein